MAVTPSPYVLMVMLKSPEAGKVKTRLSADTGEKEALRIYQFLLRHTLSIACQMDVQLALWYSGSRSQLPEVSCKAAWHVQPQGDLGQKMAAAFQWHFSQGAQKCVIIGADCPDIHLELLQTAYSQLNEVDAVIGLSEDGGYYLLGLKTLIPALFQDIPWSTAEVGQQTLQRLNALHYRYHTLPTLNDIDTLEDWKRSSWYDHMM